MASSRRFLLLLMFFYAGPRGSLSSSVRYWDSRSDLELVTVAAGDVFVAATNFVFKLDRFLKRAKNSTKTTTASGSCRPSSGHCAPGDLMATNHPKIFEIIPDEDQLLLCGSDRNGLCSVVDMETMNRMEFNSSNPVNYAGGRRNVFGFFSKSLPGGILYVASSFDGRPVNVSASAISARNFTTPESKPSFEFLFCHQNRNLTSSINITLSRRSTYIVQYIYGFEYKGFTYFVTLQRQSLIPDSKYETKLVRVCQKDDGFSSYTELAISCEKSTGVFYTIPLAAYLSTPGNELRRKLKLLPGEMALFVVFGNAISHTPDADSASGSVMCIYSMSEAVKHFVTAQRDCYRGVGRILAWIHPDEPECRKNLDMATVINDSFCGSRINVGIGSRYPYPVISSFKNKTYLATALRLTTVLNKTVAVIGTTSGHLLKVVIDGTDRDPYSVIDVGTGSSIRPDMEFDDTQQNIYVLSGKRISMVPLKTCSVYGDCSTCIMSGDPLNCGWCDNHCSTQAECISGWITGYCPPVIHFFTPQSGPVDGGTVVTIRGRNFGNGNLSSSSYASVKVASIVECLIEHRNSSCIICKTKPSSGPLDREFQVIVNDPSKTTVGFEIRGSSTSLFDSFSYKVASVTEVTPRIGPFSGSTVLTITGSNLEIGSNLTVNVLGRLCNITKVTSSQILCLTSAYYEANVNQSMEVTSENGSVAVKIDNAVVTEGHFEYTYSEDPVIFSIFPNKSILSGGMNLTVIGRNLNSVSDPHIYVNLANEETTYNDSCQSTKDGLQMICLSPDLRSASRGLEPTPQLVAEMRFLMDGVKELWNFPSSHPDLSPLLYSVDPEIYLYESEKMEQMDILQLPGQNLNLSATSSDYSVTVGGSSCIVTQVTATDLTCSLSESVVALSEIVVVVGNLRLQVGHLQPRGETAAQGQGPLIKLPLIISVVLVLTVIVIVCALWLTIWRHKLFGKSHQTVPNVLYTGGSQIDVMASRVSEAAAWHNPIPNPYLSHSEAFRHRLAHLSGYHAREPILDEESRRLLNDSNLLISRDRLLLLEIIGQGHFGCVFRGFLKVGAKEEMEVAVKTLKNIHINDSVYMNPIESKKFLGEALTMRDFNHIHVLKLIGIVIDKEELPLVVLPFMRHGDLLSYLRNELNSPTVRELMVFGKQIADGMNYLANLKFVHRDLAARNCMLDDNMMVKVADFGLSRDIYERDYYSSDDRKAKLPVKWMALESLEKGIYSTKTDVWSFGVVLWELMTRGVSPYPEVDNWDIIKYLKNGRRMPQPSYCPNSLYNVMLNCWNPDPSLRPTFAELSEAIHGIIAKMEGIQHLVGLNVTYVNTDMPGNGYLRPVDSKHCEGAVAASACWNDPLNYLPFAGPESTLV